jgi:ABC-type nitrate/sulfonate/bicarbonate transport system permease component
VSSRVLNPKSRVLNPKYIWRLLGLLVAVAVWELAAALLGAYRLPSLVSLSSQVFPLLWQSSLLEFQGGGGNGLYPHLLHTIIYTIAGSAIGVAAGISTGLSMARWPYLRGFAEVPIEVVRTIPPLVAIPFLLIWIGPTTSTQLILVAFYTFVMLVVTTLNAARNVNPIYSQFAATLGADANRRFRTVVLPAIVPGIAGGVRVAVGIAWGVQVVAEFLAGKQGMGQVFSRMISLQAIDVIIVGIFWITIAAVLVDLLIVAATRRLTRWVPSSG